jgi:hypothetical protein
MVSPLLQIALFPESPVILLHAAAGVEPAAHARADFLQIAEGWWMLQAEDIPARMMARGSAKVAEWRVTQIIHRPNTKLDGPLRCDKIGNHRTATYTSRNVSR